MAVLPLAWQAGSPATSPYPRVSCSVAGSWHASCIHIRTAPPAEEDTDTSGAAVNGTGVFALSGEDMQQQPESQAGSNASRCHQSQHLRNSLTRFFPSLSFFFFLCKRFQFITLICGWVPKEVPSFTMRFSCTFTKCA